MTTTQSMTDLVKRLLEPVIDTFFGPVIEPIKKEAADEIERLRDNAKQDARYLAAYRRICQKHGFAPSSSKLIEAMEEGE